ncbi:DUF6009 family protein [Methanospirillum hungatei]|uniref:DUF6009 family protein n=1 Tax=Methanospirillum hungatei TaxID=2203 RepID=UPI0026F2C959|nr:DUF6009 family protein [Methanospirillum hungatei]MCA1915140.1 DUF6009 family protein [Methanospirillum hungatei]
MITWLDNPLNYSYVRKTLYISLSSRFPVKTIGNKFQQFGKLIGYELVERRDSNTKGVYLYHHQFYWLKEYDRDLSPDGVYKGPRGFGGRMPTEAVNPVRLVERGQDGRGEEGEREVIVYC